MNRARRQAGFSLIEVMTVMAILALLAGAVIVYVRPDRTAADAANVFADAVREAARRAFARGPVRADLADRHRTEVRVVAASGGRYDVVVDELVEGTLAGQGSWVRIRTVRVIVNPNRVDFTGWKTAAQLDNGTSASAPAIRTDITNFLVRCFPNGLCDAATAYFGEWRTGRAGSPAPSPTVFARTVVVPLGGAVIARRGL